MEQKQDADCEEIKPLTVGSDYMIKEDAEAREAKMIDTIDDILAIAKTTEAPKEKSELKIVTLVHRQDNLTALLYDLLDAGYNPGINFEAGRLTAIKVSLNGILYMIQTQQLIKSAIDGVVAVDDEETYNMMNQAMMAFNHRIFLNGHKSYYTDFDLDILDEYRTRPLVGNLSAQGKDKMAEIDVTKAYTSALGSITEIPIFNEFDAFVPYDGSKIQPLNLYVVKSKGHALESHGLLYGKYLEGQEILAYKTPSFVKKVDYQEAIDELFKMSISQDADKDTHIKKLVANVNIGLLEKCFNKKSRGYLFQDLGECQHYQAKMGGSIHVLHKIEDVIEAVDFGLDDDTPGEGPRETHLFKQSGDPIYVLVIRAEALLKNGFRYIKELLLQHHNHKLKQAWDTLAANDIKIYSVKTDCFTIRASDLPRARVLLPFDQGHGSWRLSKSEETHTSPRSDAPGTTLR